MNEGTISLNRRGLLAGALTGGAAVAAAGGLSLTAGSAEAAAPLAGAPMAGALRRKVGAFEVTALLDGYLQLGPELIIGLDDAEAAKLRKAAFVEGTALTGPVSAYLVNTGDKLVLIDAGTSDKMGPTLGHLGKALEAAGVTPDQIDAVLITHMHPDHLFGVLTPAGGKAFQNAELILPETDNTFWYDDANMNAAPEQFKPFFLGARAAADAYKSAQSMFTGAKEIVPGITAKPMPGHTPGHTGYVIESGGERLIIAADVVHASVYQFAKPDWAIGFDIDPAMAVSARKAFFDEAAADRVMFAGMHIPFPGFGHVVKDGEGYRFVSADWPYTF
ncbi:glyoxylase-like metal-dependent hydrolase (beta-lactamase superfamily II) [Roseibium hamelinense]|uniref:Glyoxylase-like metal-dependent hydrolase (Beta-lactamase superfamily II) n=1 Tax=Roseibium hamelinense TaxID=150831 RepID=A0A562T853_9HYPH|nr:MBL fold metallo-hydrolase [Roseibium hamelinense]MTI42104.1 MBL fold metallo-hydrolase [Roseibium hamelinense]TWI89533.1 glyoxylase-like metal-dependent hydrolase (beta-lactamase superfamily II) [Roseibium hamelinense]